MRDRAIDLFRVDERAIRGQPHHHVRATRLGSLVVTVEHVIEVTPEAGDAHGFTVFGNGLIAGVSGGRHYNLIHQFCAAGASYNACQHGLAPHQAQHFAWQARGAHSSLDDCNGLRFAHFSPLRCRLDGIDGDGAHAELVVTHFGCKVCRGGEEQRYPEVIGFLEQVGHPGGGILGVA